MIEGNYVYSYFKTYFPAWWSSTSRDPGPGCGDACEPFGAIARGENAFLHDEPRYERYRIFGMLKPSFQRWIGKIRIMELVPSGSGPKGPGQFRIILKYKPQAPSYKHQASSFKRPRPAQPEVEKK